MKWVFIKICSLINFLGLFLLLLLVPAVITYFLWVFLGNNLTLKDPGVFWATAYIGFVGAFVATLWNWRNDQYLRERSKGAINISVTPENVVTVHNVGDTALKITHFGEYFDESERYNATYDALMRRFEEKYKEVAWRETKTLLDINDLYILPFQKGASKAIEEIPLAFQIVGIKYIADNRKFSKYYCVCRLTNPSQWFRYQISQIGSVNVQLENKLLYEQGRHYPEGLIDESLYKKSLQQSPDQKIFPGQNDIQLIQTKYPEYLKRSGQLAEHYPENRWFVFSVREG